VFRSSSIRTASSSAVTRDCWLRRSWGFAGAGPRRREPDAGTGVTVRRIAGWHNLGLSPEEIAAKIEHLTLAQIHAALAYYHANRDEVDSDIAAEDAATEEIFPTTAKQM
jgi:hypothetical protein